VVDLSSLWAGPVTARILAEAGARVTKVESRTRPDAARTDPAFYRWVHGTGQASVRLDFRSPAGRAEAAALLGAADVVIEASRPRALEQLGLGPDDLPERPGRVWLSVTGHGRRPPGRDWVAFGDDAAVAGGLVGWDESRAPVFCGDAIADPITGLVGAVAVLRALADGGGILIDLPMRRAAAIARVGAGGAGASLPPLSVEAAGAGRWVVRAGDRVEYVREPARVEWIEAG
jgi:crotonobetainyl-CoA:carnitine CoA-transferase CaiB-like acyl-CoA transferase